jgi:hypothetical protein
MRFFSFVAAVAALWPAHLASGQTAVTPPAPALTITDFILVNTATAKDILLMHDGMTVDINKYGKQLTIRVETAGATGYVKMEWDDGQTRRVEQEAPYHLAGEDSATVRGQRRGCARPAQFDGLSQ